MTEQHELRSLVSYVLTWIICFPYIYQVTTRSRLTLDLVILTVPLGAVTSQKSLALGGTRVSNVAGIRFANTAKQMVFFKIRISARAD